MIKKKNECSPKHSEIGVKQRKSTVDKYEYLKGLDQIKYWRMHCLEKETELTIQENTIQKQNKVMKNSLKIINLKDDKIELLGKDLKEKTQETRVLKLQLENKIGENVSKISELSNWNAIQLLKQENEKNVWEQEKYELTKKVQLMNSKSDIQSKDFFERKTMLDQRIMCLSRELENVNNGKKQLEVNLKKIEEELDDVKGRLSTSKTDNGEMKLLNNQYLIALKEKTDQLNITNEQRAKEIKMRDGEIRKHQKKLEKMDEDIKKYQDIIESKEKENKILKLKVNQMEKAHNQMEKAHKRWEKINNDKLEKARKEKKMMDSNIKHLNNRIKQTKINTKREKDMFDRLERKGKILENSYDGRTLRGSGNESVDYKEAHFKFLKIIKSAKTQIENAEEDFRKKRVKMENTIANHKKSLEKQTKSYIELEKSNKSLMKEIEILKKDFKSLKSENTSQVKKTELPSNKSFELEVLELKRSNEKISKSNVSLNKEVVELRQSNKSLKKDVGTLKKTVLARDKTIETILNEIRNLKNNINDLTEVCRKTNRRYNQMKILTSREMDNLNKENKRVLLELKEKDAIISKNSELMSTMSLDNLFLSKKIQKHEMIFKEGLQKKHKEIENLQSQLNQEVS